MEFIRPRNIKAEQVDWEISEQSRALVKCYAEYTEYTENDVVDMLLKNILQDKNFVTWVQERRFNKRIMGQIFIQELVDADEREDDKD